MYLKTTTFEDTVHGFYSMVWQQRYEKFQSEK